MAKAARILGTPLMPWQRHVVDVAFELDPDGRLHYRKVGLTVPRQSGKTTLLLAINIDRCFNDWGSPQHVSYTAQSRSDARKKWEDDWLPILEASPFARSFRTRLSNGHEATIWKGTGSIQDLVATTRRAGHGKTLDLGIIDEAFAQVDDRLLQAMNPAMITRPEPQLWTVSTAGDEDSAFLWETVENGRAAVEAGDPASRVAYFEWSADPDADPLDEATWWACMPALGHTITVDAVRAEAETLPLDVFRRSYLNLWVRKDGVVDALPGWAACRDEASTLGDGVAFAVDVAPDQQSAAIAAAGASSSGGTHLEVVDHRLGTGWVVGRLLELRDRWSPVSVSLITSGPAGALLPDLRAAGLDVSEVNIGDLQRACGGLSADVSNRAVVQLGQPVLDLAVDGAVRKPYGDGAWLWSRRHSSVDICPLVAVTVARWGWANRVEPDEVIVAAGWL